MSIKLDKLRHTKKSIRPTKPTDCCANLFSIEVFIISSIDLTLKLLSWCRKVEVKYFLLTLKVFQNCEHNMAEFGKDEVPILSDTIPKQSNEPDDSKFQSHVSRTRSVSISIPMFPTDPYERDTNLRGHTGPLRSKRKTPFSPMSGPLYVTHRPGNISWQNMVAPRSNAEESKTEKFPLSNIMSGHDLQNNYASKNEHLVRSGPLGMCNDPYCTTCPTYFKATQQMDSKNSGLFNPKVCP
jgi:hypothetical protein